MDRLLMIALVAAIGHKVTGSVLHVPGSPYHQLLPYGVTYSGNPSTILLPVGLGIGVNSVHGTQSVDGLEVVAGSGSVPAETSTNVIEEIESEGQSITAEPSADTAAPAETTEATQSDDRSEDGDGSSSAGASNDQTSAVEEQPQSTETVPPTPEPSNATAVSPEISDTPSDAGEGNSSSSSESPTSSTISTGQLQPVEGGLRLSSPVAVTIQQGINIPVSDPSLAAALATVPIANEAVTGDTGSPLLRGITKGSFYLDQTGRLRLQSIPGPNDDGIAVDVPVGVGAVPVVVPKLLSVPQVLESSGGAVTSTGVVATAGLPHGFHGVVAEHHAH